jgi:DNA repair protein RadC
MKNAKRTVSVAPPRELSEPHSVCREVKIITVSEQPLPCRKSRTLDSSEEIFRFWNHVVARSSWYEEEKEQIVNICIDVRYRPKHFSLVSLGSLNESIAHPREIFRPAIIGAAFGVILAHNHPSGDPSPSVRDIALTRRVYEAAGILQIEFLDHVIVGASDYFSFREGKEWPPPKDADAGERDLSQSYDSRNLGADRLVRIPATEKQWDAVAGESRPTERLAVFLANATARQLRRLRNLTPLFFDGAESPGCYVCARNFRATDTFDWQLAKDYRALVNRRLRECQLSLA